MRKNFYLLLQMSTIVVVGTFPWNIAGAQDATSPSLADELKAKYALTASGSDSPGAVLKIKKEGILGVPPGNVTMARQAYKDGELHEVSKFTMPLLGKNTRYLKAGEKVYVRKLDVNLKKNEIALVIFECDTCNGAAELASYKAEVVFEFPKGSYVNRSAILDSISQVFALDNGAGSGGAGGGVKRGGDAGGLKVPGTYVNAQTPTDQLQLNADNSLSLNAGGQTSRGTFTRDGNILKITIPDTNVETTMTFKDGNLTDAAGQVWSLREQVPPPATSGPALRNEDIIKLAKVGIDDATLIAKIGNSKCQFDTSPDVLIQLKQSGVSAAVLKAMVGAGK
jgi:hypothetical protein